MLTLPGMDTMTVSPVVRIPSESTDDSMHPLLLVIITDRYGPNMDNVRSFMRAFLLHFLTLYPLALGWRDRRWWAGTLVEESRRERNQSTDLGVQEDR
jgi:hypothetical protein